MHEYSHVFNGRLTLEFFFLQKMTTRGLRYDQENKKKYEDGVEKENELRSKQKRTLFNNRHISTVA